MTANEASAVGSLRTLNTACIEYSTTYGGYPAALNNLGPATPATSTSADLIDSVLATGTESGYTFAYAAGASDANGNVLSYSKQYVAMRIVALHHYVLLSVFVADKSRGTKLRLRAKIRAI